MGEKLPSLKFIRLNKLIKSTFDIALLILSDTVYAQSRATWVKKFIAAVQPRFFIKLCS